MKGQVFAYLLAIGLVSLTASVAIFALSAENQAPVSYDGFSHSNTRFVAETLPVGFQGTSTAFGARNQLFERPTPLGTEIQDPWPDSGTGWD